MILTSIALYRALADTRLHQLGLTQGSGPDWLVSPTGTPNRPAVAGLLLLRVVPAYTETFLNVHTQTFCIYTRGAGRRVEVVSLVFFIGNTNIFDIS